MDNVILNTFPENEIQALAMLYVQNQDLSSATPEQLLDMYQEAYDKIKAHRKEKRNASKQQWTV